MKKYEYMQIQGARDDLVENDQRTKKKLIDCMNALGNEGWELVSVHTPRMGYTMFWFKREVPAHVAYVAVDDPLKP